MLLLTLLLICPVFINAAPVPGRQLDKAGKFFNNLFGKKPSTDDANWAANKLAFEKYAVKVQLESSRLLKNHPNNSRKELMDFEYILDDLERCGQQIMSGAVRRGANVNLNQYQDLVLKFETGLKAKDRLQEQLTLKKKAEINAIAKNLESVQRAASKQQLQAKIRLYRKFHKLPDAVNPSLNRYADYQFPNVPTQDDQESDASSSDPDEPTQDDQDSDASSSDSGSQPGNAPNQDDRLSKPAASNVGKQSNNNPSSRKDGFPTNPSVYRYSNQYQFPDVPTHDPGNQRENMPNQSDRSSKSTASNVGKQFNNNPSARKEAPPKGNNRLGHAPPSNLVNRYTTAIDNFPTSKETKDLIQLNNDFADKIDTFNDEVYGQSSDYEDELEDLMRLHEEELAGSSSNFQTRGNFGRPNNNPRYLSKQSNFNGRNRDVDAIAELIIAEATKKHYPVDHTEAILQQLRDSKLRRQRDEALDIQLRKLRHQAEYDQQRQTKPGFSVKKQ